MSSFFIIWIRWRRKGQDVFVTSIVVVPFPLVFACCRSDNKKDLELSRNFKEEETKQKKEGQ